MNGLQLIQVSDNLWLTVDPVGRIIIGSEDRVVRIEVEERQAVIDFIKNADKHLDIQIAEAEAHKEEMILIDTESAFQDR